MYSLKQKKFLAKKANQDFVTLSMKEVDKHLAEIAALDQLIAQCMTKLSAADNQEIFGDMFTGCPSTTVLS